MQILTLKTGQLGRSWHAAHIILSIVTCGWWLPIYGIHALISVLTRPTVQVEVPEGHRVECRDGWPNVLAPDEYLEPRTVKEKAFIFAGYASPLLILVAIIVGIGARS